MLRLCVRYRVVLRVFVIVLWSREKTLNKNHVVRLRVNTAEKEILLNLDSEVCTEYL